MRARALAVALVVTSGVIGVVVLLAVLDSAGPDRPAKLLTADISTLKNGRVMPVAVTLPSTALPSSRSDEREARVLFIRRGRQIKAFLGVSTHLGCSLRVPGDPEYGKGFAEDPNNPKIEDPCGGSTYGFDGRCIGGPCPRDLDRYHVRRSGDTALIDLEQLIPGPLKSYRW